MLENELAKVIANKCYKIHSSPGPGLLESVYEELLSYELIREDIPFQRQVAIPVAYEAKTLGIGFRADLIVENKVIIEIKSVQFLLPIYKKQLLTYLKLTDSKLGLLVNFNVNLMKDGIVRIVNNI